MKTHIWLTCFFVTVLAPGFLSAQQVATGTPSFGSFGGGPFDVVNLGNLNVHIAIPILHKAGRGIPFTYDLRYESSVWTPLTSGGTTRGALLRIGAGAVLRKWNLGTSPIHRTCSTALKKMETKSHTRSTLTMPITIRSGFLIGLISRQPLPRTSPPLESPRMPQELLTTGGLHHERSDEHDQLCRVSCGDDTHRPVNVTNGAGSKIDANGNEITTDGNGNFYDTLSSLAVLSVSGAGTPSSPMQYQYTGPSGSAKFKVKYTQYTVKTGFGVSGVVEYVL